MFGMTEARTPDGSERGTNTMGGVEFGSAVPAAPAPDGSPPNVFQQIGEKLRMRKKREKENTDQAYARLIRLFVTGAENFTLDSLAASDQSQLLEIMERRNMTESHIMADVSYIREEIRVRVRSENIPKLQKKVNELTAQHERVVAKIVPLVEERDRLAKEIEAPAGDLYNANCSLTEADRLRNQRPDLYPAQTE